MGRLVEHDATGPRKLDESDLDPEKGDVAVCQCGLSDSFPFCDGTHRITESEDEDTRYRYVTEGGDRSRREVADIEYTGEDSTGPEEDTSGSDCSSATNG